MQWGTFEPYRPLVRGLPSDMSRTDASAEFEHLMAARPERLKTLTSLLSSNGVTLGDSDTDIERMNDWFIANVTRDQQQPSRPESSWYGVIFDLALFLGDVMIDRNDGLGWDMARWGGSGNPSFQRHVVAGFPPGGSNITFDVDLRLATYAEALVQGGIPDQDQFCIWLQNVAEMAGSSSKKSGPDQVVQSVDATNRQDAELSVLRGLAYDSLDRAIGFLRESLGGLEPFIVTERHQVLTLTQFAAETYEMGLSQAKVALATQGPFDRAVLVWDGYYTGGGSKVDAVLIDAYEAHHQYSLHFAQPYEMTAESPNVVEPYGNIKLLSERAKPLF